jgi:putative chitinase
MIPAAQWTQVLAHCGVRLVTASRWGNAFEKRVQAASFSKGRAELPDFLGQVLHETLLLEHLEEDLEYSAHRLTEVWPHRFPTMEAAQPYAFHPVALANRTYGGRMGNHEPNDGWTYRGRGIPMITGHDNYQLVATLTGLPLVDLPDLLSTPDGALRCGVLWWEKRIPDSAIGDVEAVTQAVQGQELGLLDRQLLTGRARRALDLVDPPVVAAASGAPASGAPTSGAPGG